MKARISVAVLVLALCAGCNPALAGGRTVYRIADETTEGAEVTQEAYESGLVTSAAFAFSIPPGGTAEIGTVDAFQVRDQVNQGGRGPWHLWDLLLTFEIVEAVGSFSDLSVGVGGFSEKRDPSQGGAGPFVNVFTNPPGVHSRFASYLVRGVAPVVQINWVATLNNAAAGGNRNVTLAVYVYRYDPEVVPRTL